MYANHKTKNRAAFATIAAAALVLSGTAVGVAQAFVPESGIGLASTSSDTAVTDLALKIELSSHPAHSVCVDTLNGTGRLPAGCPLISILTVTNNGSEPANDVVLTAPQPVGWVDPIIERPASGCDLDENEDLRCKLGTIQPGEYAQVIVEGFTDSTEDAYVMASVARVTADGLEKTPQDNVATDILVVEPEANLSVVVQPHTGGLSAGSPVTWTAVVTNNGPSAAHGVRVLQSVLNALEADFVDVSVTTSDGSDATCKDLLQNANTARCRADILAPDATMTMTITGRLATDLTDAGALVHTTAGVSSQTLDADLSNNVAAATVAVATPQASLLMGVDGPHQLQVGEKGTWTFTIENSGPSNSYDTRLLLDLPGELEDVVVTSDHGPCTAVSCSLGTLLPSDDPMMPGNTVDVAVSGVVGRYTDSFDIKGMVSSKYDSGSGVNSAVTSVAVDNTPISAAADEPLADMQVSNFRITPVDPEFTGPGSDHRIQFTVTNNGPDAAKYPWFRLGRSTDAEANLGQKSIDQVPKDSAWQDLCQTTSRELMCQLDGGGIMAAGETINVDYTITLASSGKSGTFPDYINVFSSTEDPDQTNDYAQADIVAGDPQTELYLTLSPTGTVANHGSPGTPGSTEHPDGHPSFIAGGTFQFEVDLKVPEGAFSDAAGVNVTFSIPKGFRVNYATSADGQCSIANRVTCLLPTVSAGATSTINIGGVVDEQANDLYGADTWAEQIPFQVTATTQTPRRGGQRILKSDTATVDIVESADLIAYITPDQAGTTDAGTIGFTVTVLNTGLSGVEHAAVTAMIPYGWAINKAASNCVTPAPEHIDVNGDGRVDLTPVAPGFAPNSPDAIVCQVGELPNGDRTGVLDAGASGSIRVILEQTSGTHHSDGDVTFVAGSLAVDPDISNNTVVGSLNALSLSNAGSSVFSSTDASNGLAGYQRFLLPE